MKERPILFNGEMVRAILDGRKTQTRRPTKFGWCGTAEYLLRQSTIDPAYKSPFGAIGDRLWVRETFSCMERKPVAGCEVAYRADGESLVWEPWTPSIHMPRWASRIDLEITAVRVERVQEITEEDAKAEGCEGHPVSGHNGFPNGWAPRDEFQDLWQSIYTNWDANPWVWVYEFRRIKL